MSKAFGLLLPHSPHAAKRWLGLTAVAWGLWLLLPFDTFGAGLAFTLIAKLLPESVWGLLGIGCGLLMIASSGSQMQRVAVGADLILTLLWVFLAVAVMTTSGATSGVLYLMLGLQMATQIYNDVLFWRGGRWNRP